MRLDAPGMEESAHILLADDDHQVLSALRLVIEQESSWLVTHEFHNAEEMVQFFENASQCEAPLHGDKTCHASVLLIDWELPGFQPHQHIREIRRLCPEIKIVGLSVMVATRRETPASQVNAFVSKSDSPEHVIATLQSLML
jgi:DNA-binding NarL/FixJ family response regulator